MIAFYWFIHWFIRNPVRRKIYTYYELTGVTFFLVTSELAMRLETSFAFFAYFGVVFRMIEFKMQARVPLSSKFSTVWSF